MASPDAIEAHEFLVVAPAESELAPLDDEPMAKFWLSSNWCSKSSAKASHVAIFVAVGRLFGSTFSMTLIKSDKFSLYTAGMGGYRAALMFFIISSKLAA